MTPARPASCRVRLAPDEQYRPDLFNEPHSTSTKTVRWGGGGPNDWARAAEAAASAILAVHPDWLIFVEGISGFTGLPGVSDRRIAWWGQNLQGVRSRPIVPRVRGRAVLDRVVYSPHVHPPAVLRGPAEVFDSPNFPANMPPIWNRMFGYIFQENIAPLWVGEFAANPTGRSTFPKCTFNDPRSPKWLRQFLSYLGGDFDANGKTDLSQGQLSMSWSYWAWKFDDCQRYLFRDVRFQRVDPVKIDLLQPLQFGPL